MKRRICIFIIIACMILMLCACGGKTLKTEKVIGESEIYSESEISSAMNVTMKFFRKHFRGCTMLQIEYDEAYSQKYAAMEAEQHHAKEAIILTASFETDERGGDGSLNPNSTYKGYKWVLTRNFLRIWKLRSWGYA